jgi:hypothetical protein
MTTILDPPGSNPTNPFTIPIQALTVTLSAASAPSPEETAANIVSSINTSPDPAHALWLLWDAFFTAVVTFSKPHDPHLAFLDALRAQPPTQPKNVPSRSAAEQQLRSYLGGDGKLHWQELPRFSAQWRDVHDILEAWRDWDGVRGSNAEDQPSTSSSINSGDKYFLRFCAFSAALLKATKGKGEVHPVWVFYACRNVLESKGPQSGEIRAHRMTQEQKWALDVRVAAIWMRDGGWALWEADYEELRRHWAAALDDKTELWPREDGLTRERWELWGDRLRALSSEKETLDEETGAVVTEAAELVSSILERTST